MGRVALEAAAAGLPCILVGYSEVIGLVTPERFAALSWSNFSGRGNSSTTLPLLLSDLQRVDEAFLVGLRTLAASTHGIDAAGAAHVAWYGRARVRRRAFARLEQVYGVLRRCGERGITPWNLDEQVLAALRHLTRGEAGPSLDWLTAALEPAAARARATAGEAKALQRAVEELRTREIPELRQQITALQAEPPSEQVIRAFWKLLPPVLRRELKRIARPPG